MVQIRYNQLVRGVLGAPKDKAGNETTIQPGSVKLSSADETVATIEQDDQNPDDQAAIKITGKKPGVVNVTVTADADLDEGVKEITAVVEVVVTAGEAVELGSFSFGTPEDQPEETAPVLEEGGAVEGENA